MSLSEFAKRAEKHTFKSKQILEADIEKPFVKYAKSKGVSAFKLIILNKRGFPDRTILCPGGRVFFIEFKKKGKKPSPSQTIVKRILVNFGFLYYVCDENGQAEKALDDFLNV